MDVLDLTAEFVSHNSTSNMSNAGVSRAIGKRMRQAGLSVERIEYRDPNDVPKVCLVGIKGKGKGGLALMGHTDVVPAEGWAWDPFEAIQKDGKLYGRGSADMKGSIACMLAAAAQFPGRELRHPVCVITTADEEIDCSGARHVARNSEIFRKAKIPYGVIGEPTVMDVVYAHKGSIRIQATANGKAAHSSTGRGTNANHAMIPFLNDVLEIDRQLLQNPRYCDSTFDPPHSRCNIVISDGDTASNITARESRATINCRPMPGHDWEPVLRRVRSLGKRHRVKLQISSSLLPLHTPTESRVIQEALRATGKRKPRTVPYGTDGMIFGRYMELAIMGPGNIRQAHTVDEWIAIDQLHKGVETFAEMIRRFCTVD